MLAQLRSDTVEAVVLEALRLVLQDQAGPAQRDPCIIWRLLRLVEECPRLVASCTGALVELLYSPGFLEVVPPVAHEFLPASFLRVLALGRDLQALPRWHPWVARVADEACIRTACDNPQSSFKANAACGGGSSPVRKIARLVLQRASLVPPSQMVLLIALLTPSGLVRLRPPGPFPPSSRSRVMEC